MEIWLTDKNEWAEEDFYYEVEGSDENAEEFLTRQEILKEPDFIWDEKDEHWCCSSQMYDRVENYLHRIMMNEDIRRSENINL